LFFNTGECVAFGLRLDCSDGFAVNEKEVIDFIAIFQKSFANYDSTRSRRLMVLRFRRIQPQSVKRLSIFSRASSSGDDMKARKIAEIQLCEERKKRASRMVIRNGESVVVTAESGIVIGEQRSA
jgi:hypothetical protein